MSCILDENGPYWCEADWNCKDCPNWVEIKGREMGMTVYEDACIAIIQYPNGEMTVDKNTGRMISWVGVGNL